VPPTRPVLVVAFVVAAAASALAQDAIPPVEQQVAAAVLPLPAEMRGGAMVMGYRESGKLVTLRPGKNSMTCLALYVARPDFHVACYHQGLEPFMARGRALRAQGVKGEAVDSARFAEIKHGKLTMPAQGALYTITTKKENYDAASNTVKDYRPLAVVYIPFATPESVGLTATPTTAGPWLMFPGTPKAHIMMLGSMTP